MLNNLCMLFVIINASDEKRILKVINQYKVGFKVVMHGMGTASSSLLEYFGLNDEEKTIITAVLPQMMGRRLLIDLEKKVNFKEHGMGIAFSILLSSATKYMVDYYKDCKLEDIKMEDGNQHLIVTIVNQGYAEKVMNEAKKGGATGGTTISGRGLENEKAIKFLNIAIEPEKDVILILTSTDKKTSIMNMIVENCGLKTPGAGICFSLPVDNVAGISKQL